MKSKRTKATSIPKSVKEKVLKRDGGRCIICGRMGYPNAHLVKRSQGGMGVEENIVTLCPECHIEEDMGPNCRSYERKIEEYLEKQYPGWTRDKVTYNKWRE